MYAVGAKVGTCDCLPGLTVLLCWLQEWDLSQRHLAKRRAIGQFER